MVFFLGKTGIFLGHDLLDASRAPAVRRHVDDTDRSSTARCDADGARAGRD
jgi:hypothetical protein